MKNIILYSFQSIDINRSQQKQYLGTFFFANSLRLGSICSIINIKKNLEFMTYIMKYTLWEYP